MECKSRWARCSLCGAVAGRFFVIRYNSNQCCNYGRLYKCKRQGCTFRVHACCADAAMFQELVVGKGAYCSGRCHAIAASRPAPQTIVDHPFYYARETSDAASDTVYLAVDWLLKATRAFELLSSRQCSLLIAYTDDYLGLETKSRLQYPGYQLFATSRIAVWLKHHQPQLHIIPVLWTPQFPISPILVNFRGLTLADMHMGVFVVHLGVRNMTTFSPCAKTTQRIAQQLATAVLTCLFKVHQMCRIQLLISAEIDIGIETISLITDVLCDRLNVRVLSSNAMLPANYTRRQQLCGHFRLVLYGEQQQLLWRSPPVHHHCCAQQQQQQQQQQQFATTCAQCKSHDFTIHSTVRSYNNNFDEQYKPHKIDWFVVRNGLHTTPLLSPFKIRDNQETTLSPGRKLDLHMNGRLRRKVAPMNESDVEEESQENETEEKVVFCELFV